MISKLNCSLVGERQTVRIAVRSQAHKIYGRDEAVELFACNYGVNPALEDRIRSGALRITGYGEDGSSRIAELPGHPFFIATLYVPQTISVPGKPHPLITAYLEAAFGFAGREKT